MPATTTTGYPYPLGTDRVADGDDSIRALAEKIPQIQAGTATIVISLDTNCTLAITFPRAFPVVPTVLISAVTSPPADYKLSLWVPLANITTGGCTLAARRGTNLQNQQVMWMAYAPPAVP